jgi:hypothetical protein
MKILPKDNLTEIFKPLNYEPCSASEYYISNYGRIWDTKRGCFLSPNLTGKPTYYNVNLRFNDGVTRNRRVHNLLARTFIDKPEDTTEKVYEMVDHIDQNRYNNHLSNLRWVTRSENALNTSRTLYYKGTTLLEHCKQAYPDTAIATYVNIRQRANLEGITLEESEDIYLRKLKGEDFTEITVNGIKIRRDYYLSIVGITLEELKYLRPDLTYEEIALGYKFKKPTPDKNLKVKGIEYENIWYPSRRELCRGLNISEGTVNGRLERGMTLKEALEYKHIEEYTVMKDGKEVTGNVAELCRLFGKDKGNVRDDITLRGLTLQQALTKEPERVTKYIIDGEVIRKSDLVKKHLPDIKPKRFNGRFINFRKYSKVPLTNIQILRMTFEFFGFYDLTENIEIGNT